MPGVIALTAAIAPTVTGRKVSALFTAIYALAYAAIWLALLTPVIISLALRVRELAPADSARQLSWVLVTGAVVALVCNPVFGSLSDRSHSRFGRRRPFLIGGAVCGCAALAVIGAARNIPTILAGWCLAQLAWNATLAAFVAIVPDRIPATQRGTVVGILGICMPVGQIAGTYLVKELASSPLWMLLAPGFAGVAGVVLLACVLRERPSAARAIPGRLAEASLPDRTSTPHVSRRNFLLAWANRLLFTLGSCFLQAYQPFFMLETLHIPAQDAPRLMFQSTLAGAAMVVVWSLVAGRLSDRLQARKPFVMAGSVIQGFGLWIVAAAGSYEVLLLGVVVAGAGHGIYEGVDLALIADVLPDRDRHAAKDLGLVNTANTLPQVIAPLSAPALLALSGGDYALLFGVAGVVGLLAAATLIPLKLTR